tara:strand:+ start:1166 stop:2230 length:1065 start_codon:yes stop_codon:yes gene_type:complete
MFESIGLDIFAIIIFFSILSSITMKFCIKKIKLKELIAVLNDRSSHSGNILQIGGIGIFLSLLVYFILNTVLNIHNENNYILLLCISTMFICGLIDDIYNLNPAIKILTQIFVLYFFCENTQLFISNFYGLFGLNTIESSTAKILTIFSGIVIINSFNLIDGVDGLAGAMGLLISCFFLIVFYIQKNYYFAFFCAAILSCIASFLYFNLLSINYKIFLGNNGSLLIGFSIFCMIIMSLNNNYSFNEIKNLPVIILTLLSFQFIDTLRVMGIRAIFKKNIFHGDKNHIHHVVNNHLNSHKKTTSVIISYSIISIIISLLTNSFSITIHFITMLVFCSLLIYLIIKTVKKINNKNL